MTEDVGEPEAHALEASIEPIDFDTVESRIPFLEDGREEWIAWAFKAAPTPRIFKSHQPILYPPAVRQIISARTHAPQLASH